MAWISLLNFLYMSRKIRDDLFALKHKYTMIDLDNR